MSTKRARLSNRPSIDDDSMGLRIGVVGCGRWGMNHLNTLYKLKQNGLIASVHACDIDSSRHDEVRQIADSFHPNWLDLVTRCKLDIVALVTPPDTHHSLALAIMDYCKTMFIEKPLGLSQKEASEIIAKIQDLGGQLLIGHILRFNGAIEHAMAMISHGEIGELEHVEFNRTAARPPPDNPNIFEAMAIHGIDTACYSFGELEPSTLSVANVALDDNSNPVNTRLVLEFNAGKTASIDVGWNGVRECRQVTYHGSQGQIIANYGQNTDIVITNNKGQRVVIPKPTTPALSKEWLTLIELTNSSTEPYIYPQAQAVIRSVKWVEIANARMKSVSGYLDERIE